MTNENSTPDQKLQSGTASEIFEAMANAPGPINDIISEAASLITAGGNENEIPNKMV